MIMFIIKNYEIMKHKIITIGALLLFATTLMTAQYCPPTNTNRGFNAYNTGFNNSIFSNSYGYGSSFNSLAYSFANVVNQGYQSGKLTKSEIWRLENDYEKLAREIRWSYADGRLSLHERSMIDIYMQRLQRNISREWNDNETRLG